MTGLSRPSAPAVPPAPQRCPHCGEMNPRAAEWCWVCYGELSADGEGVERSVKPQNRRLKRSRVLNAILGTLTTVAATVAVFAVGVLLFVVSTIAAIAVAILEFCSDLTV